MRRFYNDEQPEFARKEQSKQTWFVQALHFGKTTEAKILHKSLNTFTQICGDL